MKEKLDKNIKRLTNTFRRFTERLRIVQKQPRKINWAQEAIDWTSIYNSLPNPDPDLLLENERILDAQAASRGRNHWIPEVGPVYKLVFYDFQTNSKPSDHFSIN